MADLHSCILGMDIGGTHIRMGLMDDKNQLHHFTQLKTVEIFSDDVEPGQALCEVIQAYLEENSSFLVQAVSIGFPSTIDKTGKILYQTPNISVFPDFYPIVDEMHPYLEMPIFIARDVNGLLLHDILALHVEDYPCVTGIYFGTGVGNAIQVDGKLLVGKNGVAAELGHIPMGNPHIQCGCGNWGCLETEVSGLALKRIQEEIFPDTFIGEMFSRHADTPTIQHFVRKMGETVALEVDLFDPDAVIIGGGLLQMEGFPLEEMEKAIFAHTRRPYPYEGLTILYSSPTQENGVIGAALYGRKELARTE